MTETPAEHLDALRRSLSGLATETADPALADLDTLSVARAAALMNDGDRTVADAVARSLPQITAAVEGIVAGMRRGGRLVYAGAGTAGRLGILDASECPPTFGTDPDLVVGLIAGGERAIRSAVEGAEDDADAAARLIDDLGVGADDAVVGISASGRTPFAVGAVERARARGAFTVGLAGNADSPLGDAAAVRIEIVTGPEFIAGSTRLRAGTAQKLVLNMISTLTMVQLGKTYGNVMVDLQAANEKLRARSLNTVMQVTGVDAADAASALEQADGSVKLAILIVVSRLSASEARARLAASGGRLREALARD